MVAIEKYHGTGNDFVVVDADAAIPDRRQFARAVCDRQHGVSHPESPRTGADGVLFLDLDPGSDPPRVDMTLIQPDGSRAAMCGNGARCVAHWAVRRLADPETGTGSPPVGTDDDPTGEAVADADAGSRPAKVIVDTDAGPRRAEVGEAVTIEMGTPTFDPGAVPVESGEPLIEADVAGLPVTAVNTGVPHAVAVVDDVADVDLEAVGPEVRHADVFPEGANLTVAARRDGGGFDQRTYERGVEGETRSCGTGAVAVGAVAQRLGTVERGEAVPVHPPGGRLVVTVADEGTTLRGPVTLEFATEIPLPADATGD